VSRLADWASWWEILQLNDYGMGSTFLAAELRGAEFYVGFN